MLSLISSIALWWFSFLGASLFSIKKEKQNKRELILAAHDDNLFTLFSKQITKEKNKSSNLQIMRFQIGSSHSNR